MHAIEMITVLTLGVIDRKKLLSLCYGLHIISFMFPVIFLYSWKTGRAEV